MVHGVAKIKHDLATKRNKRRVDYSIWEFPDSSVGKEPTCKAGDPGLIPGLGISRGEGIGYPPQYAGLDNSMDYTVHVTNK